MTLQDRHTGGSSDAGAVATVSPPLARPSTRFMAETEVEFYQRRKKSITVRHVSGDRVVAVLEIVSPGDKPPTTVSYECDFTTRAYIEVGDRLPEMALFIEPLSCVMVPLESTYQAAYAVMPRRWREVLEA